MWHRNVMTYHTVIGLLDRFARRHSSAINGTVMER
jgi:hypothetical protein